MQPTRTLPPDYKVARVFALDDRRALILLNILGLLITLAAGVFMFILYAMLRPQAAQAAFQFELRGLMGLLMPLLMVVGVSVIMLVIHEGLHGLFFWVYTRTRPVFQFKGYYASAAAPGWYFPRGQYLVIGLAPLVGITLGGLLLSLVAPPSWFISLLLLVALNAGGAIGDLWMVTGLLRAKPGSLAFDEGDRMTIFSPEDGYVPAD